jgi:hypothetical protein
MADFASIRFQPSRPLLRELTADRLNAILTEIKRNKPKGERGITVRQDGTSTYIGLASAPQRGGGTSAPEPHPFKITSAPVQPQGGGAVTQYMVKVGAGTINGIISTNWNDEFLVAADALRYVVVDVETNGKYILSSETVLQNSPPTPDAAVEWSLPQSFSVLIGAVQNTSVYQAVFTNLVATGKKRITTEKSQPIELGELPYDNWYSWEVS